MIRVLAVALGPMVALAAPPAGANVQIIGAGLNACWTWTADRAARGYAEVGDEQWVVGFLSAAAVWAPNLDPLKGVDAEAMFGVDGQLLSSASSGHPRRVR